MQRHKLELSAEKIAGLDLDALARKTEQLNRRNRESYTAPFPKDPSRWLSHYRFEPRTIAFTSEGEVEGKLSWLVGSLFDLSFVRSLLAPHYSKEGGRCFDPASLFFLELALKLDGYSTDARLCRDLRQQDQGERYRTIAGIQSSIPGKDDLCRFRSRVGFEPIDSITGVFVRFLTEEFSLINGKVLCTDGQLEPSFSRYRGCAYFCAKCRQFPLDQSHRQQLHDQIASGAKRLQITCPFPEAVEKIRQATKKKDFDPKVALIEIGYLPQGSTEMSHAVDVAHLLGMDSKQLPPMIIKWSRLSIDSEGKLVGSCAKTPSDLEAAVGYHIDNENPDKKEQVFGYLQQRTTAYNAELGLELPVSSSTYPANAHEGNMFISHRDKTPIDYQPGQIHCLDSGYDQQDVYLALVSKGAIGIIDYNPRRENLSEDALRKRGYDRFGAPYAPCGRLCRSNGYDYLSESRQYVCGLACSQQERSLCSHGAKARGYSHRMSFRHYPRLIGAVQRGTEGWKSLYGLRTASERTNGYSQEVIEEGKRRRLRGLKAFSFAGSIGILAQLLRRALNFVLDVTYTAGRLQPLRI